MQAMGMVDIGRRKEEPSGNCKKISYQSEKAHLGVGEFVESYSRKFNTGFRSDTNNPHVVTRCGQRFGFSRNASISPHIGCCGHEHARPRRL